MKNKKQLYAIVLALLLLVLSVAVVACAEVEQVIQTTDYSPYEGAYYLDVDGNEYLNVTLSGNRFFMTVAGNRSTGSYTVVNGKLFLVFDKTADAQVADSATATFVNGVLVLNYNNTTSNLQRVVSRTVVFEVDGSTYATRTVYDGRAVNMPAVPTKENSEFVTWCTDADLTNRYNSDTPVRGDITLYARFKTVREGEPMFTATFVDGNTTYGTATTYDSLANGDIAEKTSEIQAANPGKTFLGWWFSDLQDATKLTARYTNQLLNADVKLFAVWDTGAPIVSVYGDRATDNIILQNTGSGARIKLVAPDGTETDSGLITTSNWGVDFSLRPAGLYEIRVTTSTNQEVVAYYHNKALSRVFQYSILESSYLFFEPVDGAVRYEVKIIFGDGENDYEIINLGTTTIVSFAHCSMPRGGIKFEVTAIAGEGMSSSVSDLFVYARDLGAVTGLTVDSATDIARWDKVADAAYYYVTVRSGNVEKTEIVTTNSYSVKEYGNVTISVVPYTKGFYSPDATTYEYTKARLATPSNIKIDTNEANQTVVSWDAVEGASEYIISVRTVLGTETYTSTGTEMIFDSTYLKTDSNNITITDYVLTIVAVGSTTSLNSLPTDDLAVKYAKMGEVNYKNGVVSWDPVLGAVGYGVRVDYLEQETLRTGTLIEVENGEYSARVTLNGRINIINVFYYYLSSSDSGSTEVASAAATKTVNAYAIHFDPNSGNIIVGQTASPTMATTYVALGDPITFPQVDRDGYNFSGWYDIFTGAETNGKLFNDTFYQETRDIVVYAYWTSRTYFVDFQLDPQEGQIDLLVDNTVKYREDFTLGVPTSLDPTRVFTGWYTGQNGTGTRITDENGKSVNNWNYTQDGVKLYANWRSVFAMTLSEDGTYYTVAKGEAISTVTSVTIPYEYEGLPVSYIGNFMSCTTLVTINVPDTIVAVGNTSFQSCTRLEAINVYHVEGDRASNFGSHEGVLYQMRQERDENENYHNVYDRLFAYPTHKNAGGTYQIPVGVSSIEENSFYSADLFTLIVPHTVSAIMYRAFYLSDIVTLTFEPTPEGEESIPLVLGDNIFQSSDIVKLDLPARISSLKGATFASCTTLTEINVVGRAAGQQYSSAGGVLCNAPTGENLVGDTIIFAPKAMVGTFTVPGGILKIGGTTLDENGTEVWAGAFRSCTRLTGIVISSQVEEIGEDAFRLCSGLTSIVFNGEADDRPLTIKQRAFASCTNTALKEIRLPANLKVLETNAFASCTNLTTVYVDCALSASEIDYQPQAFGTISSSGYSTFYVTTLYMSATVPEMDISVVFGAERLASCIVADGNPNYSSDEEGVLYNGDRTKIILFPKEKGGEYELLDSVTEIGGGVFYNRDNLTGITIGPNVTIVGNSAFVGCGALRRVTFEPTPEGEQLVDLYIGDMAFYQCNQLQEVVLPERCVSIGEQAFRLCNNVEFTSIVIPNTVKVIGDQAFASCTNLQTVTLPASLEKLGEYGDPSDPTKITKFLVFDSCTNLNSITIDGESDYFAVVDGVLYKKSLIDEQYVVTDCFLSPRQNVGTDIDGVRTITVPATVTKVWESAFEWSQNIDEIIFLSSDDASRRVDFENYTFYYSTVKKITLPIGMYNVPRNFIYYTDYLAEIEIPYTVREVHPYAFYYCDMLESIKFADAPAGVDPVDLEFIDLSSTIAWFRSCPLVEEIVLPERMTTLPTYFLYSSSATSGYYAGLKTVTIPSTVTEISARAFYYCNNLEYLILAPGSSLKTIGTYAFYHCDSLMFEIPETVTAIDTYAFTYCTSLTTVTIPAGVTVLNNSTFSYCSALQEVKFAPDSKLEAIGVHTSATTYTDVFYNCTALKSITIPKSVRMIGNRAFFNCRALETVAFEANSSMVSFGNLCFANTGLKSFKFPDSESFTTGTTIFNNCNDLVEVTIMRGNKSLDGTFAGCRNIKRIIVDASNTNYVADDTSGMLLSSDGKTAVMLYTPIVGECIVSEGVTIISPNLFENQTEMTKVTLPTSIETIGTYAFSGCTSLVEVEFLGDEDVTFGTHTFNNCTALTTINLPAKLTKLSNYMFRYTRSLTSITLPESLARTTNNTNGTYAFQCSGLTSITIPAKFTVLPQYFLSYCPNLSSITFEGTMTEFGQYSLAGTGLSSFQVPAGMRSLPASFLRYCSALEEVTFASQTVTTFGNYCFANTPSLKTIELPSSTTTLGTYMFQYSGLEEIEIPARVRAIANYAFQYSALKTIDLPDTITSFGTACFDSAKLTSIKIPAGIKTLGSLTAGNTGGAFYRCTNLAEIDFGTTLEALGSGSFRGCTALTKLTIPDNIKTIGIYAFEGSGITELTIEGDVTFSGSSTTATSTSSIPTYVFSACLNLTKVVFEGDCAYLGTYMFNGCTSLTDVTLPDNLEELGGYTFRNCSMLTTIHIPASVKIIGGRTTLAGTYLTSGYTFQDCTSLTEVTGGLGVELINTYAFDACASLTSISLGNKVQEIRAYAFRGTSLLTNFSIPTTVTVIGANAFQNSGIRNIVIPSGVTTLGASAFRNTGITTLEIPATVLTWTATYVFAECLNLETVVIRSSVMGTFAFNECTSLERVEILGNLTIVPRAAFQNCSSLEEVILPDTVTTIAGHVFYATSLKYLSPSATSDVNLPSKLEIIGCFAFGSSAIESVNLPATLITMGNATGDTAAQRGNTFSNCTSLKQVTFAAGIKLTELMANTFNGCSIETINLPESLTAIRSQAFFNCDLTGKVTIPKNVTQIGTNVFAGNWGITSYEVDAANACFSVTGENFIVSKTDLDYDDIKANTVIAVPPATSGSLVIPANLHVYGYAFNATYIDEITFGAGVTEIGANAFVGMQFLTKVNLENVTTIGAGAFRAALRLQSVDLSSCTSIGANAFDSCPRLTDITLPTSANVVFGASVFANCTALEEVVFPEGVAMLSNSMFSGCTALKSVTLGAMLPNSTESIGTNVFQGCTALESIVIPEGYTTVGNYMFSGCTSLKEVTFPSTMTEIKGTYAFEYCGFETLTFPRSLKYIGNSETNSTAVYTFRGCENLTEVIFEGKIELIGPQVFRDCVNLAKIDLASQDELLYIGSYAFSNTAIERVVLPMATMEYGTYAFAYNTKLVEVTITSPAVTDAEAETSAVTYSGYLFAYCPELKVVNFLEIVEEFTCSYPFRNCWALETINIPTNWTEIPADFYRETGIKTVVIPEGIKVIRNNAFDGCYNLTSVTLPNTLEWLTSTPTTSAGGYVFRDCTALQELTIPASVTALGQYSFTNCTALKNLYILGNIEQGGGYMFQNFGPDQTIYFASSGYTPCTLLNFATTASPTANINSMIFNGCNAKLVFGWRQGA